MFTLISLVMWATYTALALMDLADKDPNQNIQLDLIVICVWGVFNAALILMRRSRGGSLGRSADSWFDFGDIGGGGDGGGGGGGGGGD